MLSERRLMTWNALCYETASLLSQNRPYAHVIADECQDFGPAELTLLRAFAGLDREIRKLADAFLPDALDEGEGKEETRSTVSLLNGPAPEVQGFEGVSKETDGVARWLQSLIAEGYQPRDIAIFTRTDAVLRDRAGPALEKAGLTGHLLSDEQPPSATDASLGTMHRAKGLEFKVVALMGCNADLLPRRRLAVRSLWPCHEDTGSTSITCKSSGVSQTPWSSGEAYDALAPLFRVLEPDGGAKADGTPGSNLRFRQVDLPVSGSSVAGAIQGTRSEALHKGRSGSLLLLHWIARLW